MDRNRLHPSNERIGEWLAVITDGRGTTVNGEIPRSRLTGREMQVMDLLALNKTSKQVGSALGLSSRTIDNHCVHIIRKLGVRDRFEAVRIWQRRDRDR